MSAAVANKELAGIDREAVRTAKGHDEALTLAELAVATGLPYSDVKALAKEKGFPRIGKRVFPSDFKLWRRRRLGLQSAPETAAHRPLPAAGKPGEPRLKHG